MNFNEDQIKKLVGVLAGLLVVGLLQFLAIGYGINVTLPNALQPAAPASGGISALATGLTQLPNGARVSSGATRTELTSEGIAAYFGSAARPGYAFWTDEDTGVYRVGANNLGIAAGGTKVFDCTATGCTVTGNLAGTLTTAAQPNITSVGTLPLATVTNLTSTTITGTLATANQPNITNLGTQTYFTTTNAISMGGATFTGPIKYGAASSKGDQGTIAHGMGSTPTACTLTPVGAYTATVVSLDATNITISASGTIGTLYWMCGK